jgi:hypothetical protein
VEGIERAGSPFKRRHGLRTEMLIIISGTTSPTEGRSVLRAASSVEVGELP